MKPLFFSCIKRLHPMVSGTAGWFCSQFTCWGSGSTGSLHHSTQPDGLDTCQTDPPISTGGLDQDSILLQHSPGTPGGAAHIPNYSTFLKRCIHLFIVSFFSPQVLIRYWQPVIGAPCLWSVRNAPWSIWFPLLCFLLHFICWAIICSIIIIFDYPELMGIKQVRILFFIVKKIKYLIDERGINKYIISVDYVNNNYLEHLHS